MGRRGAVSSCSTTKKALLQTGSRMDGSPKESLPACSGLRRHGLFALSGVRAGGAAEDHAVGDGVAAEAVGAVDAARRFTGGVEARNHLAVDVKHLCFETVTAIVMAALCAFTL